MCYFLITKHLLHLNSVIIKEVLFFINIEVKRFAPKFVEQIYFNVTASYVNIIQLSSIVF